MKNFLLLCCVVFFGYWAGGSVCRAQSVDSVAIRKLDAGLKLALSQAGYGASFGQGVKIGRAPLSCDTLLSVILQCRESSSLVDYLCRSGIEARSILPTVATAHIPASRLLQVAQMPRVLRLSASTQAHLTMRRSREFTGTNRMHSGEELETPYTGKGVVIGIIDQGFEYLHPAFAYADGSLRIKRVWNRDKWGSAPLETAESIWMAGHDGMDDDHATHVAGIAAGSRVEGTSFYGNAPDADLVFIPSTLGSAEIIEDVKYIMDYAESEGKPCVINMSFGGHIGAHDGMSLYDQTLDALLGDGRLVVGSAGNEGDTPIHGMGTMRTPADTLRFLFTTSENAFPVYLLGDDSREFNYGLLVYDPVTGQQRVCKKSSSAFWSCADDYVEISDYNVRYSGLIYIYAKGLKQAMGMPDRSQVGICVFDAPADYTVHLWTAPQQALLSDGGRSDDYFLPADYRYTIGDMGASSARSISVGAYVSTTSWQAVNGLSYKSTAFGEVGAIASFSSLGPQVNNDTPKPLIAAPGHSIASALSKMPSSFSPTAQSVVQKVSFEGEDYYYGMMSGTSMAAPQVTGIVACWLQAYPWLTPDDIVEIVRKTAINDTFTGDVRDNWHPQWGYGKIDAYNGLKECLKLAVLNGVDQPADSETPITLYKGDNCWKVLFNNNERGAVIRLVTLSGITVSERRLSAVSCGHEEVLDLSHYVPGCYVLHIQTARSASSRKVLVR